VFFHSARFAECKGNFRLLDQLLTQIERVVKLNQAPVVAMGIVGSCERALTRPAYMSQSH
jgi:hypothetical protein